MYVYSLLRLLIQRGRESEQLASSKQYYSSVERYSLFVLNESNQILKSLFSVYFLIKVMFFFIRNINYELQNKERQEVK